MILNQEFITLESKVGCNNYKPLPVVLAKGSNCVVTDVEGNDYLDCLAGYGAINQGHCHPKLVDIMQKQCATLTLTSRAFHNDKLPVFAEFMTKRFGYGRVLPMNSGVEAGESAIKIMRRYAYEVNKVPADQAVVLFPKDNFWGRSIAACSSSTDPDCYHNYGPFMSGFVIVDYGCIVSLKKALGDHKGKVAGLYIEPIQGEAGIIVPPQDYLAEAQKLLNAQGALLCCDEIQSGLGRTGMMLASDHFNVKPDLVVLGKALSGGMMPVSCVLGSDKIMSVLTPGTHGSTYGGNPLGMEISMEAIKILDDEKLCANALAKGEFFRNKMEGLRKINNYEFIKDIRGRGLFNAIEIDPTKTTTTAYEICKMLMTSKPRGLLCKQTHDFTIRFTPPLTINDEEMNYMIETINNVFKTVQDVKIM